MSSVGVPDSLGIVAHDNIVPCPIRQTLDCDVKIDSHINPKIFKLMNFHLVGKGEKGKNCGYYHVSHVCESGECGKAHYMKNRCYRKECPDCYEAWKMRAVNAMEARLYSEKARLVNRSRRLSHIIVSMGNSENIKTKKDFNKMIQDAYRFVDAHGLKGGVVIMHGYRATSEAKYKAHQADKHTWEWIREQPHHERYMRYSPHFHFIGYYDYMKDGRGLNKNHEINLGMQIVGDEDEKLLFKDLKNDGTKKDRELEKKWIYKSVLVPNSKSIQTFNHDPVGLRRLSHYLLSHTVGVTDGRFNSIRWFGNCTDHMFGTTEEEKAAAVVPEMKQQYCKICGAPLVRFSRWIRENYYYVMQGKVPEPKYFIEIEKIMGGEGPPKNANNFEVGDVEEK